MVLCQNERIVQFSISANIALSHMLPEGVCLCRMSRRVEPVSFSVRLVADAWLFQQILPLYKPVFQWGLLSSLGFCMVSHVE